MSLHRDAAYWTDRLSKIAEQNRALTARIRDLEAAVETGRTALTVSQDRVRELEEQIEYFGDLASTHRIQLESRIRSLETDGKRFEWLIKDYRSVDLYNTLPDVTGVLSKNMDAMRKAIDIAIAAEATPSETPHGK